MIKLSEYKIEDLLPQYYFNALMDAKPDDFERQVRFNLNMDEEYKFEVLTAFSYYEALKTEERNAVRRKLAEVKVSDLLTFIGQNNEILLQRVELLFDKKVAVISWLSNQLTRGKAMILTFDQLIIEGKQYEQNTTTD